MREIPQDIYYEILYSRLLDCGDLKACSLVCRAWLSVTRGLLFKAIRLSEEQAFRDFKKALTRTEAMRSSVSHCVRKVTISDLGLNMDGLSRDAVASSLVMHQLLSMLPSLRTLRLERVEWDHTDPSLPVYFENIPITSLLFARTRFPSPGHLLQLVANLPCLSSLSISFIEWGTVDLEDSDLLSNHNLTHPIHIQSLKVYKCSNARGLLRGLLAPPSELRLARLEWTWSDSDDLPDDQYQRQEDDQYQREEDEAPLLSTLLQASSTTLAELRLSIVWDDSLLNFVPIAKDTPVKTLVLSAFRPTDCVIYDTYLNSLPIFLKGNAPALSCLHVLEIRLGIFDRYAMYWGMDWGPVDTGLAILRASCPALVVTLRITFVSYNENMDPLDDDLQSLEEIVEDVTAEMHEYLLPSSLAAGLPVHLIVRLFQPGQTEADAEEQEHWL